MRDLPILKVRMRINERSMIQGFRVAGVAGVVGVCALIAGLSAGSQAGSRAIFHHPRIPVARAARAAGWTSSNWSGYALPGSRFTSVTGQWTVRAAAPSRKATYSCEWVGIDGYNNSSLIQTGTESDYRNGSAHQYAWWEILPAAEIVIPSISVHPGDHMKASISRVSRSSSWTITIADTTTNSSFRTTQTYTGPETSAEWIEEAPTVGGRVATLANYGLATLDPETVNGGNPRFNAGESGVMVQNGAQVSTPSNPDTDTDGFNAAYGSTAPSRPSS
jgi:hypothetical protein